MMSDHMDGTEDEIFDEDTEYEELSDNEIEAHIAELLEGDPEDFDELEEYIDSAEEYYSEDIYEFTFCEAIRSGAKNYVEEHIDEFDLNDEDEYSSYLYETDDPDMRQLLMDYSAYECWDDYECSRFAIETLNWEILAFNSDFQKEVFAKYLEKTNLTEEKVKEILTEEYDQEQDEELPKDFDWNLKEDFDALGISVKDGKIQFENKVREDGMATQELLERLEWTCKFEGTSWQFETIGVYFIN